MANQLVDQRIGVEHLPQRGEESGLLHLKVGEQLLLRKPGHLARDIRQSLGCWIHLEIAVDKHGHGQGVQVMRR